jgi:hypothetical protein
MSSGLTALLDGDPLEAAFVEARTALNGNDWDWARTRRSPARWRSMPRIRRE